MGGGEEEKHVVSLQVSGGLSSWVCVDLAVYI